MIALVVVTVVPESVEAYTQRLINHWKRHSRALDSDRFVFILIAKNDRAIRIVPSKTRARGFLKPFMNSGIMFNANTPLKQDKYFEALVAMVDKLSQLLGAARSVLLNGKSETVGSNVRPKNQDARFRLTARQINTFSTFKLLQTMNDRHHRIVFHDHRCQVPVASPASLPDRASGSTRPHCA